MDYWASEVSSHGELRSLLLHRRLKRGARSSLVVPSRGRTQLIDLQS